MNLKRIYSFIACGLLMLGTACSPDDYSLGTADVATEDLVEGLAFTVDVDQATNTVTMKSLLGSKYVTSWIHPQGTTTAESATIRVPFAGDYTVQCGVMTREGLVYGEPYSFTINNTNGELLTDPIWTNLTGGQGQSKTWRIDYADGASLAHNGPFYFKGTDDCWESITLGRDLGAGADSWAWDADVSCLDWIGITPANFATLTFDLIDGAHVALNGQLAGAFTVDTDNHKLNLPSSAVWYDADNFDFAQDWYSIRLLSLDEYTMSIGIIRKSDPCLISINYVADGWDGVYPSNGGLTTSPVTEPSYDNLEESLFTIVSSNATYLASATTLLLDDETPYQWLWWNPASAAWEDNGAAAWAPTYADAADFSLTLSKTGNAGVYLAEIESAEGSTAANFTISGNKLKFNKTVTLFSASNAQTTVTLEGDEFTVLECNPDDSKIVLGVPASTDETGAVNKYLCANFTIKAIGSGETGPTKVAVDNDKLNVYIQADSYFRIELYNPWNSSWDWPIDITKVKLKDGQTLSVTFKVSGLTWDEGSAPKAALCHNMEGASWEPDCFGLSNAVTFNKSGETTVTVTNNTGSTVKFDGSSCVTVCIELAGYGTCPLLEDGSVDTDQVTAEVTSITIQ
jgi:hypothetical protein